MSASRQNASVGDDRIEADLHCRRGNEFFARENYNDAIREYKRALEATPQDAQLHYLLAESCSRKGWHITARALYCTAFRISAEQVRALQVQRAGAEEDVHSTDGWPQAVFVLGCPHSGTTITTRLIANHPELMHAELTETHVFTKAANQVRRTLQGWDKRCRELGKTGWVEKSVSHSFQIPRMLRFRPDAKFIVLIRDGRDVTASMKTRWYAHRSFDEVVNLWLYVNRVLFFYGDSSRFHVVRYEQLVEKPEATLRSMCEYIGVKYSASMLEYHEREITWKGQSVATRVEAIEGYDDHEKLRHWQINQPLFDGRGRWRCEMTENDKRFFKSIAGEDLQRWGYSVDNDW